MVIAGPTASGKSLLSMRLAASLGGVVINADSMQVYKEFRVLTARPSTFDEEAAPHRLYGDVSVRESFSAGKWLKEAKRELVRAKENGQVPIVVGGSGLYIRALMCGLADVPKISHTTRAQAAKLHAELGGKNFRIQLAERDAKSARQIKTGDRQRLIRAWEVIEETGVPLSEWQAKKNRGALGGPFFVIKIMPERSSVYEACNYRFSRMLEAGVLDEVAAVHSLGLPENLPALKALGFRTLCRHLFGELTIEECKAIVCQATRNYAKRQFTWFCNQLSSQRVYADPVISVPAAEVAVEEFLLTEGR